MPIRKRQGSWEVALDIGPDPVSGRRRRRYQTVRGSKKDALRALTAAERERDTGIDILPEKLTVAAYFERWLIDYAAVKVAPTTLTRYTGITRDHIVPAIGHLKLTALRPQHLQNAYALWLRPGSRKDGSKKALSSRTVLHHHRLIHEALEQAVKWQLIARNPAHAVSAPRVSRRTPPFLLMPSRVKISARLNAVRSPLRTLRDGISTALRQGPTFLISRPIRPSMSAVYDPHIGRDRA